MPLRRGGGERPWGVDTSWNDPICGGKGLFPSRRLSLMQLRTFLRWSLATLATAASACGGSDAIAPSTAPAAGVDAMTDLTRTAAVGSVLSDIVVKVTDASGRVVQGAPVAFAVTSGSGSVNPRVAVTDAKGQATTVWTIGTTIGANELTASVAGVTKSVVFSATGSAGPVNTISLSTKNARLLVNVDTMRLTAKSLDAFGNAASPTPTFIVRDPTLVSIDATGLVRALRRGSGTYIIASAGGKSDSTLVTVLAAGQSVCTAAATPVSMAVGQVLTDISASGFCVHADVANAEYALIPYYDAAVPNSLINIEAHPAGVSALPLTATALVRPTAPAPATSTIRPNEDFEAALRERERVESAKRPMATGGMQPNRNLIGAAAQLVVPAVGDLMKLNVNAMDFCDNPDYRTARVMAVTNKAIVVADTSNPAGGFTSDEFKSIGVTFDTLINPIDSAAFGPVSDIDNNGRVIMLFTRAVNELTEPGSPNGVVLGFYYRRDLYPKSGPAGTCTGSNVGEMFYLMVPDTGGVVNGNKRTKSDVVTFTNGTVAHEYQHLINASGRLYGPNPNGIFEEKWLDEGLAHTAEDLNFWAASGLRPRTNVDNSIFSNPKALSAYNTFGVFNIRRYATYLGRPETQGPVGFDANDADLQTRGAIWSLLRYIADQRFAGAENTFWNALVNSRTTGLANLTNAIGSAPNTLMRDWAISVFMDDNAPGVDPRFTQPSWNVRSLITNGGTSIAYPLVTRTLSDGVTLSTSLASYGVSFMRFSVPSGQDALLSVSGSSGGALPPGVRVSIARVK